jgi:phosphatidylserine decarboxylase
MSHRSDLNGAKQVPGGLLSVNAATAVRVPQLFSRDERVACLFDGPHGPFGMVLVGALAACSISTVRVGQSIGRLAAAVQALH